jgi:hypothetical protein
VHLIEKPHDLRDVNPGSPLFICQGIPSMAELSDRGIKFDVAEGKPHLIAGQPDRDLWMASFEHQTVTAWR